ncbi:hypothetical protein MTOK_15990 [Mycolicibacterium tokaiense]|nr:hypothetical protein MTOK_15990 [Mycolicibacterium tokaiense]
MWPKGIRCGRTAVKDGLAGEFVKVTTLLAVESQDIAKSVQDRRRGRNAALFESGVIVVADGRQLSNLLTAQTGNAPTAPRRR